MTDDVERQEPEATEDLPQSWIATQLGDIADIVGGGTPSTRDDGNFAGGTIPWITPADLTGYTEKYITTGARAITKAGFDSSGARMLPKGAVLYSSRAPIGYVAIAKSPVCTNQGFKSFVLPEAIDSEYVYFYLKSAKQIAESLASGTTFLELSGAKAAQIPFPLAPLPEQRRIVAEIERRFSHLDASVADLKRAQAQLKRYRASVLAAACEGRLVPTEAALAAAEGHKYEPADALLTRILDERRARWEKSYLEKLKEQGKPKPKDDKWKAKYEEPNASDTSDLPELPEGWKWATVDELTFFVTSGSRGWAEFYSDRGPLFIRIGNLNRGDISLKLGDLQHVSPPENAEGARTRLQNKDILVSITANLGSVGLTPSNLGEAYINQHIALCRSVFLETSTYIAWYLSCENGQNQLLKRQRGATKIGLGLEDIKSVPVPFPPLSEQRRIVAEVERLLSGADELEAALGAGLKQAERLRQAILRDAFAGKLVPQDPADEPASALLERIRAARAAGGKKRASGRKPKESAETTPATPTLVGATGKRRGRPPKDRGVVPGGLGL